MLDPKIRLRSGWEGREGFLGVEEAGDDGEM